MPETFEAPFVLSATSVPTSRKRVLHVLEATLGGTMRYLRNVAEASANLPLELGFAYATERADHQLDLFLRRARELGWTLFPVAMTRAVRPAQDLRSACDLLGVLRQFQPEIVHCHSSKAGALGRIAALGMAPRPRTLYSPHAIMVGESLFLLQVEKLLAKITDRIVAVTESERRQLSVMRIASANRIEVIHPSIDTSYYAPKVVRTHPARNLQPTLHIVSIGRLIAQKRPLDFLRTIAALRDRLPGVTGTWVGDGELRAEFERSRHDLGLDEMVAVTGWVQDVRPFLAEADAFLSSSAFESFGYMVAEAMAMGVPVVATRIGGTLDIGGEAHLHLYPVGVIDAAAELLVHIQEDGASAQERAELARLRMGQVFSTEAMELRLAELYLGTAAPAQTRAMEGIPCQLAS